MRLRFNLLAITDVVGGKRVTRLTSTLPPSKIPLSSNPFFHPLDSFHPQTGSFNPNVQEYVVDAYTLLAQYKLIPFQHRKF